MLAESRSSEEYQELLEKAVSRLQAKGYEDIRVNLKGFEEPVGFNQKKSDIEYIPDLTARRHKGKCYFEIAKKTANITSLVSKWKLLSTIAEMKNGRFTILIPYGHNKFTQELIEQYSIKAELIKLD